MASALPSFEAGKEVSTRAASGTVINALAAVLPELWGGSADLAESNLTTIKDAKSFIPAEWSTHEWSGDPYGRVLHFGIREHAMGAIVNGIKLHGPTRPFGGTFLIFSDYMRPSVRLAALMDIPSIFVWTHDSVALGEDGPTHQPVEQLATLRAIPNFTVVRPADANETSAAWLEIVRRQGGPSGIALTRQNIPVFPRGEGEASGDVFASTDGVAKGAYILAEAPNGTPDVILIATGSEVQLALQAQELLAARKIAVRVVSMPSTTTFDRQELAYKKKVLPKGLPRIAVEMGVTDGWWKYGCDAVVGIDTYGESAPAGVLFKYFGFTAENVAATVEAALKR